MYLCPVCSESHVCIIRLKAHWKLKHCSKLHTSFPCRQKLCTRNFCDIHSFWKHLTKTHADLSRNGNHTKPDITKTGTLKQNYNNVNNNIAGYIFNTESTEITHTYDSILHSATTDAPSTSRDNSITSNMSTEEFREWIAKTSALFVAKLYSQPSLSRSFCREMIGTVQSFLDCISIVEEKYKAVEMNPQQDVISMFNNMKCAFADHSSEYYTMLYFKTFNTLIEPQEISIGASIDSRRKKTGRKLDIVNKTICIVPLKDILKNFLELPNVYNKITRHIREIKHSKTLRSTLQSEVWLFVEQQYNNDVLPLILYFDEFEINNPLGSHRGLHKLGVVYCTIGGISEEYASLLENIFLVQLHNVVDYTRLGNKQIFAALINQINSLQTDGITINIENSTRKINFSLLHILGDNLGLHAIFGLTTSFNSTYSCRFCVADTTIRKKMIVEDVELLRTINNYATDVSEGKHGVIEECVFHSVTNFHMIKNASIDVMHDLFEGVCRYDIGQMLCILINKEKLFSLETLNDRIHHFDYGADPSINIPPCINVETINKKYIIYSASEMVCLLQYLGLIIGDLVPKKNKTWKLYVLLRKIISITMAQEVTVENIDLFKKLTSDHHKLYINLFKDTLKPKHHHLLHYPRIMEQVGPLKGMSCIRFEAKHKQLKETAKAVTSRKNPMFTLAVKHQLQLNYRFLVGQGFEKRVECGVILYENIMHIERYADFQNILPPMPSNNYKCVSWVRVNGTFYKENMVIALGTTSYDTFGKIKYILKNDFCEIFFIYQQLQTIRFSFHFYAYEVTHSQSWGCIAQSQLVMYKALNIHLSGEGKSYVPNAI